MRQFLKAQIARLPPELIERVLGLSLLRNRYSDLERVKDFPTREQMWDHTLEIASKTPLRLLEFGVWEGYSINYFAKIHNDPDARFWGFDSFEGLPEDWTQETPKGSFSTGGLEPKALDDRVSFVKGWFDATLPAFLDTRHKQLLEGDLIVHFDADLYSSTLFCLVHLDQLKREYIAIFDEFYGAHEPRALNDYAVTYGADIEMLAKASARSSRFPTWVVCRIRPK